MRVSRNWLQDYVDIKISDDELAEKIVTIAGADIDGIETTLDDKIIVAEIIEVKSHPKADKLRLAEVNTGQEKLEIVCGAPNIAAGQKVPLALIGAKIQGHEISKVNIRGVESNGMLCSARELGIGEDHSGIMILPEGAEIGKPVSGYLSSDTIFDLEITPNRGDCLSHLGIAREIAAFTHSSLCQLNSTTFVEFACPIGKSRDDNCNKMVSDKSDVKVCIDELGCCPRYFALEIKGVHVGPSPEWLQTRLTLLGVKPINNVVDITNYIMFDMGQPLHAFDADKIAGNSIIIRLAEENETIMTLDEKVRSLHNDMLVIADPEKPLALAGIMGGVDSSVTEGTANIILEAAEFDRKNIRKTSKTLGLATEASYRFERGIDSCNIKQALFKAAGMIKENAGGNILGDIIKAGKIYKPVSIDLSYNKINNLLGLNLSSTEIDEFLGLLGFDIVRAESDLAQTSQEIDDNVFASYGVKAIIPSWRHDIEIWQDLAEEVGRMYGYSKIPEFEVPATTKPLNLLYKLSEYIKDLLMEIGFVEVKNYPFLSQADITAAKISTSELLEIANPVQVENKYLRNSTIPSLIKNVAKNPAFDPVLIFEIGNVFSKDNEKTLIGVAASGKNARNAIEKAAELLINLTDLPKNSIHITELVKEEISRFKVRKDRVYVFEVPVIEMYKHLKVPSEKISFRKPLANIKFRSVSQYPSVTRDIAMIVGDDVNSRTIIDTIYKTSPLIILVELFDEFVSDKFGHNKKSLAYHLFFQHLERTLNDREVDDIVVRITSTLKEKYGAEIR